MSALNAYIERLNDSIMMFISLHAYGQMILGPWGYKKALPDTFHIQVRSVMFEKFREMTTEKRGARCDTRYSRVQQQHVHIRFNLEPFM